MSDDVPQETYQFLIREVWSKLPVSERNNISAKVSTKDLDNITKAVRGR